MVEIRLIILSALFLHHAAFPGLLPVSNQPGETRYHSGDQSFPKEIYILFSMGSGSASDGTLLSFSTYTVSDGTKVTVAHGNFDSIAAAKEEFRRETKLASRIVEQGSKKGRFGGVVGNRAVLVFIATSSSDGGAEVVWTNGSELYMITSPRLRLVLDMEKRSY